MINTKEQYLEYLERDRIALGRGKLGIVSIIEDYLRDDNIWRYQRMLRKVEYLKNVKASQNLFWKLIYLILMRKLAVLSRKLGFTIPLNVFGPGLAILHYGTIIVNPRAKVGANCRIHADTNIGESGGQRGGPIIGDNVYLAPGVKIYGKIRIGNNIAFAANAAVGKDCLEDNSLYGGIPAKRIKEIDITRIIKHLDGER